MTFSKDMTLWIENSHVLLPRRDSDDRKLVIQFWSDFYTDVLKNLNLRYDLSECVPTRDDSIYQQEVYKLLECYRGVDLSEDELRKHQRFIELQAINFDEHSIYRILPSEIKLLILKGKDFANGLESAKIFLLNSKNLTEEEKSSLNVFGQYTLEVLISHVLSMLFNAVESNSVIRLSTLIDSLDTTVRTQISLLKSRKLSRERTIVDPVQDTSSPKKKATRRFQFGVDLVEFMQKRNFISITQVGNIDETIRKKGGNFYLAKHQNVCCNFKIECLPIRFSLPMICKPEDWRSILPENQKPKYLSHLRGGYLSSLTADLDERCRLLSSHNIDHFYIELHENPEKLCNIMNKLQSQPFEVNSGFLEYIRNNKSLLVDNGLLLPSFLSKLKINDIYETFKNKYYSYNFKKRLRLSTLFKELSQLIQRAGYEQYILKLAIIYEGYRFYLPAFLDFRGRIYRSGILHFHERDLARSLVVFAKEDAANCDLLHEDILRAFIEASSFHYQGYVNNSEGFDWLYKNILAPYVNNPTNLNDYDLNKNLIIKVREAKKPLQLLSCVVVLNVGKDISDIDKAMLSYPITQDASASAYQLMSYFLLDTTLAKNTNLIKNPKDDNIQDLYEYLLEEVKVFIKENYKDDILILNVGENLTRKIVKNIYMPMIYGKTIMSTAIDLQDALPLDLGKRHNSVAKVFYVFFEKIYSRLYCLMNMINNIGWFSSVRGLAVCYNAPLFTTIQDYIKTTESRIWVYDKNSPSKRRVSLRIQTDKRDSRKTMTSTFVNFIHQKDACLAMSVVNSLLEESTPIYTVHDNFLSTLDHSFRLPGLYINAYKEMGSPLWVINEYIYMNLAKPGTYDPYQFQRIIPTGELESLLNNCIPIAMRNKKNNWNKKKTIIVNSYKAYINAVCGTADIDSTDDSRYRDHLKKWFMFKNELSSAQYSLHY